MHINYQLYITLMKVVYCILIIYQVLRHDTIMPNLELNNIYRDKIYTLKLNEKKEKFYKILNFISANKYLYLLVTSS